MTTTIKLKNENGIQDWETEHQAVTRGKFNCRGSSKFNVCSSHKIHNNLTMKLPVIGNKTYHHRYQCQTVYNIIKLLSTVNNGNNTFHDTSISAIKPTPPS